MEEEKKKINICDKGIACYILATKIQSKKVTDLVGTFLKNSDGFQVLNTKLEYKKVTDMVGTFLNKLPFSVLQFMHNHPN
ncbi:hypothetical protein [Emticicia sp. C21]|uniref:hypothetical protein n=1 Tax=Emticicia sp. C21 TaxID=2302915 RepID=UPI000E34EFE3|nr:hypothetical protein [Emticicia sp. C21]RFS13736.1 hypothetical protein D0T08_24655 [Emticicia sp. C21]